VAIQGRGADRVASLRRWSRPSLYAAGGLAVLALLVWLLPIWLTRRPGAGMSAAQHLSAISDARTGVAALLVALGAVGSLIFTGRSYRLNWEGHVTDRYTKAVSQLGDESSPVRIGGVYALERIAKDSTRDRATIIYVLGVFIRERSRFAREREDEVSEDVYASIQVVGRLMKLSDVRLNLRGADLRNADLSKLPGERLLLKGADLRGAVIPAGVDELK
jgi:hypothetical protein